MTRDFDSLINSDSRWKTGSLDPPWPEHGAGKIKRGADRHYPLIKKKEDILRVVLQSGEWNPADSAHLYIWVTNNYLEWGLWLMSALGFTYKTNIVWIKVKELKEVDLKALNEKVWMSWLNKMIRIGIGQYFRGSHELLLFGTKGKTRLPEKALPSSFMAPRGRHSEKPDKSYQLIEQTSSGPYMEFFARDSRPGWSVWGNEV